jgi:hypothetical protein
MVEFTRSSHVAGVYQVQSRGRCLLGPVTWQEFTKWRHAANFTRCSHVAGVYQVLSLGKSLPCAVTWQEFIRCSQIANLQVQSRVKSLLGAVTGQIYQGQSHGGVY